MVSRTEIGTSDGEVEYLEEGIQQYWEDEKETLAVFESMLKSLQKLDDGVFVDLMWAMNSEYEGEDFIKKLRVDETNKVAANPLDARSFYFAELINSPQLSKSADYFLGVQYVALDLTQFIFKKFGYYWLLLRNRYATPSGTAYTIYFFKERPPSLWWSGGMFIKGMFGSSRIEELRREPLLQEIPYIFSPSSPIPKTKKAQDKLKKELTNLCNRTFAKGETPHRLVKNQMQYINGKTVGDFDETIESPFKRQILQANAVWNIAITKPTLYTDKESEIPKDAIGVRKMGDGFSYSKMQTSVQQLPSTFSNLSSLPQPYAKWSYENECEEYLQENISRYRVIQLSAWGNQGRYGVNPKGDNWKRVNQPSGIETTTYEGDKFWSLFDEEAVENNKAIYQKAISFTAPSIYQYKTQFGVLNHLAV